MALRLLRGEPIDALSRELGVEVYRLERWKEKALAGLDAGLKEREGDPLQAQHVATFREQTVRAGKTIVLDRGAFMVEDEGPWTAPEVMEFDRRGHLVWVDDGTRALVGAKAVVRTHPVTRELIDKAHQQYEAGYLKASVKTLWRLFSDRTPKQPRRERRIARATPGASRARPGSRRPMLFRGRRGRSRAPLLERRAAPLDPARPPPRRSHDSPFESFPFLRPSLPPTARRAFRRWLSPACLPAAQTAASRAGPISRPRRLSRPR